MTYLRARRTTSALALLLAAGLARRPSRCPGRAAEGDGLGSVRRLRAGGIPRRQLPLRLHRGGGRDTTAAATYYREAVRADPRNAELVERAFVSLLADGALPDAFRTAEKLIARDPTNGLANLTLGVRQIKAGQWASARQNFSRSGRGAATDLTATLLTAWSYAGAGDAKKAMET